MRRLSIAVVLFLGGFATLGVAAAFAAPSTTVEITDVYNSVDPKEEWFQLYNITRNALTLENWQVCGASDCVALPTTRIEPFSLAKVRVTSITGWPATGLDGANDMLGLLVGVN